MTERIEFGSKAAADQFRDEYADHLCTDDDRRLKTVAISSSAPDHVLEATAVDDQLTSVAGVQDEQCGHAVTHCEEGDSDACDFLVDECDFDKDEVQSLLSDLEGEIPEDEISDKWLGALERTWTGYHNATDTLEAALEVATEAINHAVAAARAINGIRRAHGQDEIEEFRDLERLQRPLVWDPTDEIAATPDATDLKGQNTTGGFERDIGQWEYEASNDGPAWRLKRDRMDGGELLVTIARNDRGRVEHIVGNLDELERRAVGEFPTCDEALESAVSWMERHPDGIPGGWFRTNDRQVNDGPDDEPEGPGQFGARHSDTKVRDDFESDT
ncbi:hypothetical protein [Natrinema pallidum]|uniref:hypothetical protein n=1 Tax=Natrinema pallidum TaxID=69527 RepID=UPI001EE8FD8C|nr:hypothetical protein [Natrinema pallidum]